MPEAARGERGEPAKRVFVVEVWHEGGAFRAAARDVAQEQALRFDEPGGLTAYLSGAPADPVAAPATAPA